MTTFQAHEFSAGLPQGLKDKTVNIFSLTDEGPSDFSLVVARDQKIEGETFVAYVARQLALLQQRLPLFRAIRKSDMELGRQAAVQIDYTWQSGETQMFQRQVIVFAPAASVMLLITATCKERLEPRWEAMFSEFLSHFRLH